MLELKIGHVGFDEPTSRVFPRRDPNERRIEVQTVYVEACASEQPRVFAGAAGYVKDGTGMCGLSTAQQARYLRVSAS